MTRASSGKVPTFFLSPWGEVVELPLDEIKDLLQPDGSAMLACSDGEVVFERVVF